MKRLIVGISVGIMVMTIIGVLGYGIYSHYYLQTDYSFKGIELQKNNYLSDQSIKEKEQEIYKELGKVSTRSELKDLYYGLGYLKFFSDEYELSNEWFLKALEINDSSNSELQAMIMVAISNNYYLLNQGEESDRYYQMAIDLAMENEDDSLLARIFRSHAALHINRIESFAHAARLINFALYLETEPIFQIECKLLLAQIYMVSGDYTRMYDYLQQAWMGAEQHNEPDLLAEVAFSSAMGHFLTGQYQKTISCINYLSKQGFDQYIDGINMLLGYSYYYLEGYDSAIEVLDKYQQEKNSHINYYQLARVGLLINEGRYDEANHLLDQVKSIDETKPLEAVYRLALLEVFNEGIDLKTEYEQLLNEIKSSAKWSILHFIFILLNDKSIGDDTYIQQIITSNKEMIESIESNGLEKETLSLTELRQVVTAKQLQQEHTYRRFAIICISLLTIFFTRNIYFSRYKRKINSQLEFQKRYDVLTQTLNYEYLDEEIRLLKGSHCDVQFLLFNISCLKKYNETYGYLAGNQVLKRVAYFLKKNFPHAWITRYNSHQFLVVITDSDQSINERLAIAIKDFEMLDIKCVTDLSNGKLLLKGTGSCHILTKDFSLDECLKGLERQL